MVDGLLQGHGPALSPQGSARLWTHRSTGRVQELTLLADFGWGKGCADGFAQRRGRAALIHRLTSLSWIPFLVEALKLGATFRFFWLGDPGMLSLR
jgi:hypothetical protein